MNEITGRLTERQIETIQLMMQGLVSKQIADRMGITERTVKTFRAQAMERLGAKTPAELVAKYLFSLVAQDRELTNFMRGPAGFQV